MLAFLKALLIELYQQTSKLVLACSKHNLSINDLSGFLRCLKYLLSLTEFFILTIYSNNGDRQLWFRRCFLSINTQHFIQISPAIHRLNSLLTGNQILLNHRLYPLSMFPRRNTTAKRWWFKTYFVNEQGENSYRVFFHFTGTKIIPNYRSF